MLTRCLGPLFCALALSACGAGDGPRTPTDEQCREACRTVAPVDCRPQCTDKCRGPCLDAPSDLHFEFAATTRIVCAPNGGAVSFEVEHSEHATLLACK